MVAKIMFRLKNIPGVLAAGLFWLLPGIARADLLLSTATEVSNEGAVDIALTLKNTGSRSLEHIHPMFHFHHSHSMSPVIHRLGPGESVTIKNSGHPRVIRVGRYPLAVIVNYVDSVPVSQLHSDSFYYMEPLTSAIEGEIRPYVKDGASLLRVFLKNTSSAFKNVEMMILFPPGLSSETFKGMKGFTLRGGEERHFEVPVSKLSEIPAGEYPIHLMVEYGELMKHYTGEIRGKVVFPTSNAPLWPHLIALASLSLALLVFYRWKFHRPPGGFDI